MSVVMVVLKPQHTVFFTKLESSYAEGTVRVGKQASKMAETVLLDGGTFNNQQGREMLIECKGGGRGGEDDDDCGDDDEDDDDGVVRRHLTINK